MKGGTEVNTLLIIPTLNEEGSILSVIEEWLGMPDLHILFVDDQSVDSTVKLVTNHRLYRERIFLLSRPSPKSYNRALVEGISWGLENTYSYFCHIDCDGTQDSQFFAAMIEFVKSGNSVIGSRWVLGGNAGNANLIRNFISRGLNYLFRKLIGIKISDATHSYRLFDESAAKSLVQAKYISSHFFSLVEMAKILESVSQVKEIPITARPRIAGNSTVTFKVARLYALDFTKYVASR